MFLVSYVSSLLLPYFLLSLIPFFIFLSCFLYAAFTLSYLASKFPDFLISLLHISFTLLPICSSALSCFLTSYTFSFTSHVLQPRFLPAILPLMFFNLVYYFPAFFISLSCSLTLPRKKHSTIHPLVHFLNHVSSSLDKKNHTIAIFCDLRKAFDTVNHTILLSKLKKLGVRGVELQWFSDYLSNRKQLVHVNGSSSSLLDILIGVPQGSILGPLLF